MTLYLRIYQQYELCDYTPFQNKIELMKYVPKQRHYCDTTRKLHVPCLHADKTGISVHVVVRDGYCYRSENCLVISCKYNRLQSDIKTLLSLTW